MVADNIQIKCHFPLPLTPLLDGTVNFSANRCRLLPGVLQKNIIMHQSVLLLEAIQGLNIQPAGCYIDATFGRGGHSQAILKKLNHSGRLIAIDKDPAAITHAHQLFQHDSRFSIHQMSFASLGILLEKLQLKGRIDGILFDLGVSSPQLDEADRGFSFLRDGVLDMRMDNSAGTDAATWLATVDKKVLANVLWEYGEERFADRIAQAIVRARAEHPIQTTRQLAEIIAAAHPAWQKGKHPATQSFQAIRIFINNELNDLKESLNQALDALNMAGRLCVISFHSLEDRIVKHFMQAKSQGEQLPPRLPIKHASFLPTFKKIGKAIKPTLQEIQLNPRARSAVLRIGEKIS